MSNINSDFNDDKNCQNSKNCKFRSIFLKILGAFKNIFLSRITLALIFLCIGALATNSCNNYKQQKSYRQHHLSFFNENDDDFFAEFELMNKSMEKAMKHHRKMMQQAFEKNAIDENDKKTSAIKASLNSFEDEKFYNFELEFSGIEPEKINVLIENGYLVFRSWKDNIIATDNDNQISKSNNHSSFYHAISLPNYDEKTAPEITKTNDKISVKLVKKFKDKKSNR